MKKVIGLSLCDSGNIGDAAASPLDYFTFPIETVKMSASEYDADEIRGQFIIYGGGGLIHLPSTDYNGGVMQYLEDICDLSPWLVSWGVGHNVHHSKKIEYPESFLSKFRLHGVRDMRQCLPWVPCASCMSDLFHHKYEIEYDRVGVGHTPLDGMPYMDMGNAKMETMIPFIASGANVITDSYHGAYWGALLGRKVVANPASSKFYGLPENVSIAGQGVEAKADNAFLALCRKANADHYLKVLSILEEFIDGEK